MAKTTIVTELLTDDLDGSPAERTVTFMWEGLTYEIELSKKNVAIFHQALEPYVTAGRRLRDSDPRRGRRRSGTRDVSAIRAWAATNGFEISTRGRLSASVIDAYEAANP